MTLHRINGSQWTEVPSAHPVGGGEPPDPDQRQHVAAICLGCAGLVAVVGSVWGVFG